MQENSTRSEIAKLGNSLVHLTSQILKTAVGFIQKLNSHLAVTRVELLIFQQTDYLEIIVKEVNEVIEILLTYDLQIYELDFNYNAKDFILQVNEPLQIDS